MTHICVNKLTIIGLDNGLSPGWRQAIIWTNDGILLIGPLGTNFSEILIEILTFSLKKIRLKMSSVKYCPFRLGLNVLTCLDSHVHIQNQMHWCSCWTSSLEYGINLCRYEPLSLISIYLNSLRHWKIHPGYPAKRALSAMRKRRVGPFWQNTLDMCVSDNVLPLFYVALVS